MRRFALLLLMMSSPLMAEGLLPGSVLVTSDQTAAGSVRIPDQPWSADALPTFVDGAIERLVYRLPNSARTTLQLIEPARIALTEEGYEQIFSCADTACGGFDFRFQLDLIGEPDMHVDLGDFRYVLLQKSGDEVHTVSLVASRTQNDGFLHVTRVGEAAFSALEPLQLPAQRQPVDDLIFSLTSEGRSVLDDLEFATGSADLGVGPFQSLVILRDWLADNPNAKVVLVGHTDAIGSQEANRELSRLRAKAVSDRLLQLGVPEAQIEFDGAGYLAPRASNLSEEGRALNRRVEAVILRVN